jgi:hypothetical protein
MPVGSDQGKCRRPGCNALNWKGSKFRNLPPWLDAAKLDVDYALNGSGRLRDRVCDYCRRDKNKTAWDKKYWRVGALYVLIFGPGCSCVVVIVLIISSVQQSPSTALLSLPRRLLLLELH